MGAEEMPQLCVLPVLTEDLGLVAAAHTGQLSTFHVSISREADTFTQVCALSTDKHN